MRAKVAAIAAAGVIAGASVTAVSGQENSAAGSDIEAATEALQDTDLTLSEIEKLEDIGNVQIISIEMVGSTQGEALQSALNDRQAEVADLQAAIQANEKLMAKLESEDPDFPLDSVVAADIHGDQLFVYVLGQSAAN